MIFVVACIALGFCGARLPEDPVIPGRVGFNFIDYNINSFVWLSRLSTAYYFAYFLIITPLGLRETPLAVPQFDLHAGSGASGGRARRLLPPKRRVEPNDAQSSRRLGFGGPRLRGPGHFGHHAP